MSDKCGNCDCADQSQCVKKGYVVEIIDTKEESYYSETLAMDGMAAEHDGNCKCGTSCACTNCTCGH